MNNWVERAESSLNQQPSQGVDILSGTLPPLLDPKGMQAIIAPLLAGLVWIVELFRETLTDNPLDPLALLLRLIALALTVRTVISGRLLLLRLRTWLNYKRYKIALCNEGILFRKPNCDIVITRDEILGIEEEGQQHQQPGRHWRNVYIVTRPDSGRLFLAIPPVFEHNSTLLYNRLIQWLGNRAIPAKPRYPKPNSKIDHIYDRISKGERPEGYTVIPHGTAWMVRGGPYATILLGLAILYGYLRIPTNAWESVNPFAPIVLFLTLAVVPFVWIWLTLHNIKSGKGIGFLFSPAEIVLRVRKAFIRINWENILRTEITSKRIWSILHGISDSRTLVIYSKNDPPIQYRDMFLDLPLEVVLRLLESYRKGYLP